ncbi:hypothetical protein [Eleftheria terrae]|uniref:hypothetical protein n=1 Tax=Eleftheria terrae TaxID=1597781 RepID=UPI00263B6DBF|nr:hypothetical protein [Eleftheria terrae]WKB52436.1 hypothetical protein N7L95_21995 [Eleftheria terrae]
MSSMKQGVSTRRRWWVAGLAAAVLGVAGLAWVQRAGPPADLPAASADGGPEAAATLPPPPLARLQFRADASLPSESLDLLAQAAQEVRTSGRTVLIAPILRDEGDRELALRQAESVHHTLQANGVQDLQLAILPPAVGAPADQPGPHIELRLQ